MVHQDGVTVLMMMASHQDIFLPTDRPNLLAGKSMSLEINVHTVSILVACGTTVGRDNKLHRHQGHVGSGFLETLPFTYIDARV